MTWLHTTWKRLHESRGIVVFPAKDVNARLISEVLLYCYDCFELLYCCLGARQDFFFPSGLALCSCSLPFWSEQNAGLMIHSSRKTFRWTSCFLKWYCFGKYASLDRKETVWHEIIRWMLYHCVFLVWISYFTPTFVFISLSPTSDTIYTTHLYLLFSFNPLITSVIPMRQFH